MTLECIGYLATRVAYYSEVIAVTAVTASGHKEILLLEIQRIASVLRICADVASGETLIPSAVDFKIAYTYAYARSETPVAEIETVNTSDYGRVETILQH